MVQVDDESIPFAADQADANVRTLPRVEILDQKLGNFLVGVGGGNDPEESLRVESGKRLPARTEKAVLDPAGEDGFGFDNGPDGLDQTGFVDAPVEFDDHADLLVGKFFGQEL